MPPTDVVGLKADAMAFVAPLAFATEIAHETISLTRKYGILPRLPMQDNVDATVGRSKTSNMIGEPVIGAPPKIEAIFTETLKFGTGMAEAITLNVNDAPPSFVVNAGDPEPPLDVIGTPKLDARVEIGPIWSKQVMRQFINAPMTMFKFPVNTPAHVRMEFVVGIP